MGIHMHRDQNLTVVILSVIMLLITNTSFAFGNLSANDVKSLFSGNTVEGGRVEGAKQGVTSFYSEPFINYYGSDGRVYSVRGTSNKSGDWHVTNNGYLCIQWENKKEKCAPIYKDGDNYKQNMMSSKGKIKWTKTYTTFTSGDVKNLQGK